MGCYGCDRDSFYGHRHHRDFFGPNEPFRHEHRREFNRKPGFRRGPREDIFFIGFPGPFDRP